MATKKKMLQAAAGNAGGGAALNVENVFSTYLYEGNGSTQTITNGIDLDGEGGLVWIKNRQNVSGPHYLHDSEMSSDINYLQSNSNAGLLSGAAISKNSNGFSIASTSWEGLNASGEDYASWTWRKAPKFFDVVTWSGDNTNSRAISHNLGCEVGAILIKNLTTSENWVVYHRGAGLSGAIPKILALNLTDAAAADSGMVPSAPTSTEFYVSNAQQTNAGGRTYVAYLFAHNDGDGDFGPDGDADIIKCGSYTGGGSSDVSVDLGFEPSFLIAKRTDSSTYGNWYMFDSMRGWTQEDAQYLRPNTSDAEGSVKTDIVGQDSLELNSTGFTMKSQYNPVNQSGGTYIYIAIRRGTEVPESGTEVFDVETSTSATPRTWNSGFPVDLSIYCHRDTYTTNKYVGTRITGNSAYLVTNATSAESSSSNLVEFDHSDKIIENNLTGTSSKVNWMWKRAPGYFDAVAYTGDGTNGRAISHNLGVAPEMMWVKGRNAVTNWYVYHKDLTSDVDNWLKLNGTDAEQTDTGFWNTSPTSSDFYLWNGRPNNSGEDYIAYLFASLDGISKVGSYTGNGGSQTIDCGFTSGARFVLIKRTDSTSDWFVLDSARGIVAGNDPLLALNGNGIESTGYDIIDPDNSGFIINQTAWNTNVSSASYIFYAIA
jgi:hypothetical protein